MNPQNAAPPNPTPGPGQPINPALPVTQTPQSIPPAQLQYSAPQPRSQPQQQFAQPQSVQTLQPHLEDGVAPSPEGEFMNDMPLSAIQPEGSIYGEKTSLFAIVGLILSIIAPIGLLVSIYGFFDSRKPNKKGAGLAIAGIVLSLLLMGGVGAYAALFRGDSDGSNDSSISTEADEALSGALDSIGSDAQTADEQEVDDGDDPVSIEATSEEVEETEETEETEEAVGLDGEQSLDAQRDVERKGDLAALRTQVEVYFTDNGFYPAHADLNSVELRGIDDNALRSPYGNRWSEEQASATNEYGYALTPAGCDNVSVECSGYTLSVWLEETDELYLREALN